MSLPSSRIASGSLRTTWTSRSRDGFDQCPELGIPPKSARRLEILADAAPQVPGFAHVNDGAKPVFHEVDPRFVREIADFTADFG
jgi:hypothetical protein